MTATEKIAFAQEKLGLLKKTGSTVDEITTEPQKEMEQEAEREAVKPLVEFKAKVTEEVTKAWEGFNAKRAEGKGGAAASSEVIEVCDATLRLTARPPSSPSETTALPAASLGFRRASAAQEEEGIKKMIPKTEPAVAKVVGCVTIPLALVGWIVAFSSSSTEAILFVASATAFA